MKKNLYFRTVIKRNNRIKLLFIGLFAFFWGWFRLLLEVFIRKNFGERYFKLTSAIICTLFLASLPFVIHSAPDMIAWLFGGVQQSGYGFTEQASGPRISAPFWPYLKWYLFLAAFLWFSIRHWRDKQRNPSVFDFARMSTYSGDIHPIFYSIKINGRKPDIRQVETLLEPLPFFVLGLLLWLIGQKLGILLVVGSVSYAAGYVIDYMQGDDFVMDRIDEMIANAELEKAFVDDGDGSETRGLRFVGRKPAAVDVRRQLLPFMTEENDEIPEAK